MKILNAIIIIAIFVSLGSLVIKNKSNFSKKYDPQHYKEIFEKSQWMEDPKARKIVMLDDDQYAYAGWRYAHGGNPTDISFEHPPLAKYIIGFSIILFGNQYFAPLIGTILFLSLFYKLATQYVKSTTALLLIFFISTEYMIQEQLTHSFLDIWQGNFLLFGLYSLSKLKESKNWWIGIIISLYGVGATKYYFTAIVYFLFYFLYFLIQKNRRYLYYLIASIPIIILLYFITYIRFFQLQNLYDFVLLNIKMFRYFRSHVPEYPWFEVWRLLATGGWQTWWGDKGIMKTYYFNILWPILEFNFIISLSWLWKKEIYKILGPIIWSSVYLLSLSVHILFPHYLLLALPTLYILLGWNAEKILYYIRMRYINRK